MCCFCFVRDSLSLLTSISNNAKLLSLLTEYCLQCIAFVAICFMFLIMIDGKLGTRK